ncbi:MAG: SpoIID/LytB domain-containing protein [Bdellovibrionota bacterium]|mgnify:CR=1 FL=1
MVDRTRGFLAVFIFTFALSFAGPSHADSASEIRVRLQSLSKGPIAVSGIALRYPGSAPGAMGFQSLKISWKNSAKGRAAWTVEDRDTNRVLGRFEARTLELVGMSLRVGLHSMPDRLSFAPRPTGAVDVIARLELESYVRGVLPSEMPASWPLEALKAQAVAARTFALFRKRARTKIDATYDVESDVMDQVYRNPLGEEGMSSKKSEMVDRAIRETKGVVLLNAGTHPFATYFHADCGGHTEEPNAVWGPTESAGTTADESCPTNPMASWTLRLAGDDIAKKFKIRAKLVAMKILERTSSGRIAKLQMKWSDGVVTTPSGHEFRMTMGHDKVRSAKFEISKDEYGFELAGLGFGHGVGMCQWGARHLAKEGKFHREILAHYFPKAKFSDTQISSAEVSAEVSAEIR